MKKIFIVLFLILTVSAPAFAKQKLEPDWVNFMTAKDGSEWYYDVNSLKKHNLAVKGVAVKIYNPQNGKSDKYGYLFVCSKQPAYYMQKNKSSTQIFWWTNFSFKTPEPEDVSGILYNEFCRDK